MRLVIRNPTRARDYTLVGGLVLFNLDLICAFSWRSRCRRFVAPDDCRHCGYSLRGLDTPRCPECGTPFESNPTSDP